MFSINTNSSAMSALQTFADATSALDTANKRLSTGLKVADISDDASTFAVAQRIRGDLKAYDKIGESLRNAGGTVDVTQAATKAVSDMVGTMREKVTQLADSSISAETRAAYTADLTKMRSQIDSFISNASFNGNNLLKTGATDLQVVANLDGSTMSVAAHDLEADKATFDAAVDVSDADKAKATLAALDTFEQAVGGVMSGVGADARGLELHEGFVTQVADATTKGLGNLVDADIAKEAATRNALQVRQQLALQSLSSASQSSLNLLSLFR